MSVEVANTYVPGAKGVVPHGNVSAKSHLEVRAAATSILAMVAALIALAGLLDPFGYAVLAMALATAPGYALLSVAERDGRTPQLGAVVTLSAAIVALVTVALLWSTLWYPRLAMGLLLVISANLLVIMVLRPRWQQTQAQAGPNTRAVAGNALDVVPALVTLVVAIIVAGWISPEGRRTLVVLVGLLLALAWVAAPALTGGGLSSVVRCFVGLSVGLSGGGLLLRLADLLRGAAITTSSPVPHVPPAPVAAPETAPAPSMAVAGPVIHHPPIANNGPGSEATTLSVRQEGFSERPAGSGSPDAKPPASTPAKQWLAVLDDGSEIPLTLGLRVGRPSKDAPEPGLRGSHLYVADASHTVSRTHFYLGVDTAGVFVIDRGSANGTVVTSASGQSRPCPPHAPVQVKADEVVSFGAHSLTIRSGPETVERPH